MKARLMLLLLFVAGVMACKKKDVELSSAFIKYYGGIEKDNAVDMAIAADGGYVLLGTTETSGNGGSDLIVIKTDVYGNEEWHKTLGGANDDYAGGIEVSPDGGYIVVGTYSYKSNVFDPRNDSTALVAYKLNASGDITRQALYNYKGLFSAPGRIKIGAAGYDVQNVNGGYMLCGTVDSSRKYDLFAVMVNQNLARIDSSDFLYGNDVEDDIPGRLAVSSTDEYIMASSTKIGANFTPRVVRFILNGDLLLHNYAPTNNNFNDATLGAAAEIIQAGGDQFAMVGTTYTVTSGIASDQDMYLLQLDQNINVKGTIRKFGESNSRERGVAICKTNDGGFVLLGTTDNEAYIGAPEKKRDLLVIKVNANGDEEWKKTFGGVGDDVAAAVKQTSDNGYVICGTIDFGNNNDNSGRSSVLALIKLNADGELSNVK
ncbi:MAG: hypothetical protein MUF42_00090 [Cytophagaceae bacterium]|jgi:hypothetical protein|nr:hypothetical protein [Cytophagaceae bacterium]